MQVYTTNTTPGLAFKQIQNHDLGNLSPQHSMGMEDFKSSDKFSPQTPLYFGKIQRETFLDKVGWIAEADQVNVEWPRWDNNLNKITAWVDFYTVSDSKKTFYAAINLTTIEMALSKDSAEGLPITSINPTNVYTCTLIPIMPGESGPPDPNRTERIVFRVFDIQGKLQLKDLSYVDPQGKAFNLTPFNEFLLHVQHPVKLRKTKNVLTGLIKDVRDQLNDI